MKLRFQWLLAMMLLMFSPFLLAGEVTVDSPYVRAIPPGQTISAAFMTLKNTNDSPIDLLKASSDIAEHVELHEHIHDGGMMKMRQVDKISIAANSETTLKPGGYHIMLIGLKKAIKPSDIIDIKLSFSDGSETAIKAEVKKITMGIAQKKDEPKGINDKIKPADMKHVNPMPLLMKVITEYGDELKLSDKQAAELKQWRDERKPVVKKLIAEVLSLEADIHKAVMDDKPLETVDQLADAIMQSRVQIIRNKALCRDNIKRVLDEDQYKKVLELYKTHFMEK